jgi:shikimate kinase
MARANSIILIGMPGAGKSTLGVQLAKETARDFVDTDVLIQVREGKTLQQIIDQADYLALRAIEQEILLSLQPGSSVIGTGGSAVYSEQGMQALRALGKVIFLSASLGELQGRIHNYAQRGIARRPEQSFEALYTERNALYRHYADTIIDCDGKTQQQVLDELLQVAGVV